MKQRIGDREVGFEIQGNGPTVLLLPPFPFDRRIFSANVPALVAAGRQVVAIDYPGFGEAGGLPPGTSHSIAEIAEDVVQLSAALQISSATVLGVSMGGYVALALARAHADFVEALILADTRASADTEEGKQGRQQALATIADRGAGPYLDESLKKLVAPDASAEVHQVVRSLAETRADSLRAAIAALRDRPDRTADLLAIRCPTLVVRGATDQITGDAEMRRMAAAIAGATYVEIPSVGHLAPFEAPQAFNTAVVNFLRTMTPARPRHD